MELEPELLEPELLDPELLDPEPELALKHCLSELVFQLRL